MKTVDVYFNYMPQLNLHVMKIIISLMMLIPSTFSFAQSWTPQQMKILNKFNLSEDDHRGVVFTEGNDCDKHFENTVSALLDYFQPKIRQDLIYFCVQGEIKKEYLGKRMGLRELVSIYIEEKENKH